MAEQEAFIMRFCTNTEFLTQKLTKPLLSNIYNRGRQWILIDKQPEEGIAASLIKLLDDMNMIRS
jgi:hypothetical protein